MERLKGDSPIDNSKCEMVTKKRFLVSAALGVGVIVGCTATDGGELEPGAIGEMDEKTVRSADGTRIGFEKIGSGPLSLVIVHGALNSGEHWRPVATALAEHCTCYVMDRWGRGRSGTRAEYSFERETEDIRAVLAVAGPNAYLLGHSSGAIYALEAAHGFPVAGLMLYEPPLLAGPEFASTLDRIRSAADAERFDAAVSIFLRDEARLPEGELSSLKETPAWEQMVALASQSVREWEELVEAMPPVDKYRSLDVPTLLLGGTETESHPSFATEELERTLPNARIALLEGQGHGGHLGAPELLAKEIADFMLETYEERL